MGRGTGTGDSNTVVHASPDSQRIREHLIDIIEQVQVVRREDLTPRQAAAIWQLEQFRERRAYVQLDRIAGDLASSRESVTLWFLTPGTLEAKVATHLIGKIAGRDVTPAGDRRKDIYWIERFTIPGRMLLLASMLAGGASIYFTLDYVTENAAPGSRVPVYLFVVVAFVGAAAFLTAGVFAFRLLGIPFLTAERDVGRRE